jgi:hypothetical protein
MTKMGDNVLAAFESQISKRVHHLSSSMHKRFGIMPPVYMLSIIIEVQISRTIFDSMVAAGVTFTYEDILDCYNSRMRLDVAVGSFIFSFKQVPYTVIALDEDEYDVEPDFMYFHIAIDEGNKIASNLFCSIYN